MDKGKLRWEDHLIHKNLSKIWINKFLGRRTSIKETWKSLVTLVVNIPVTVTFQFRSITDRYQFNYHYRALQFLTFLDFYKNNAGLMLYKAVQRNSCQWSQMARHIRWRHYSNNPLSKTRKTDRSRNLSNVMHCHLANYFSFLVCFEPSESHI